MDSFKYMKAVETGGGAGAGSLENYCRGAQ